jgi:hypothetical protein
VSLRVPLRARVRLVDRGNARAKPLRVSGQRGKHANLYTLTFTVRGVVITVKPLQRRISDSPHRSGDSPWCGFSLTHSAQAPALWPPIRVLDQISVLGSHSRLCARVRGLVVTVKPRSNCYSVALAIRLIVHRSGDYLTTA